MHAVVYVGDRLKALRIEEALTQQELADRAGVAQYGGEAGAQRDRASHVHASQTSQRPRGGPRDTGEGRHVGDG
jgi:transcriptional regulator with XRE-family HTH domain